MNGAKLWFWALMDVLVFVVVVTVVFFGLPALATYENSLTPVRTITVTGEGKTTATPDLAEVTFSVVSTGQNPQTLTTNNTSKMNAVLEFVSSQNIASSDIATTDYDLAPNYQYDNSTQTNFITGYTLTQTVEIKIRDLTNVATVLGGLAPLGVNQIGGVDFTFADPNVSLAVARADAFTQAETKAQQMASDAGVSLGQVINVSENGITPFPQPVYAMAPGAAGAGIAASVPNVQPGSQDVTDDVTITYALK
jgi:uncharacterized protein